jgi:hypothetical protein
MAWDVGGEIMRGGRVLFMALTMGAGCSSKPASICLGCEPLGILAPVPSTVAFGTVQVGERAQQVLRIDNEGETSVSILSAEILAGTGSSNGVPFYFDAGAFVDAGSSLPPGESSAVVIFAPMQPGSFVASLVITDDGRVSPITVQLGGVGAMPDAGAGLADAG